MIACEEPPPGKCRQFAHKNLSPPGTNNILFLENCWIGEFQKIFTFPAVSQCDIALIKHCTIRSNESRVQKREFNIESHDSFHVKDINGASFAGFYYICFQKSTSSIEGYYFHRNSEWSVQLQTRITVLLEIFSGSRASI